MCFVLVLSGAIKPPSSWDSMPQTGQVKMVPLPPHSTEYQTAASYFTSTGGQGTIQSIERVQNLCLYQQYMQRKQTMDKENGNMKNERQLFHGTAAENADAICHQGFNRSFCGRNGELSRVSEVNLPLLSIATS